MHGSTTTPTKSIPRLVSPRRGRKSVHRPLSERDFLPSVFTDEPLVTVGDRRLFWHSLRFENPAESGPGRAGVDDKEGTRSEIEPLRGNGWKVLNQRDTRMCGVPCMAP